jgi:type I restriction enzyme M protein
VDNDYIEGVLYLPENLFYNTSAPGIILFLNKAKPKERKEKLFLVNASKEFAKGDPKNDITYEGVEKIASAVLKWAEIEKFSRIVSKDEIVKNDYNISPSRYIHVSEDAEYRSIGEIWEEIKELEEEAIEVTKTINDIVVKLGSI